MGDYNTLFIIFFLVLWLLNQIERSIEDLQESGTAIQAIWHVLVVFASIFMVHDLSSWLWKLQPVTF